MTDSTAFLDTNVLLYLQSSDPDKAERAEALVKKGGIISVQVLNEMTQVLLRKFHQPWKDVNEFLSLIQELFGVRALDIDTHVTARRVAERYRLNFYDALIVSSALIAGCRTLYSEDMQDGMLIEKRLRVRNPF